MGVNPLCRHYFEARFVHVASPLIIADTVKMCSWVSSHQPYKNDMASSLQIDLITLAMNLAPHSFASIDHNEAFCSRRIWR